MNTTGNIDGTVQVKRSIGSIILLSIIAGSVATIAFDLWGSVISPALGFPKLSPVALGTQTVKVLTGIDTPIAGSFMHLFLVGLVAYPIGWFAVARPLQLKIMPSLPVALTSVAYGLGLFVLAIGIIAGPWIAGNPWSLNWAPITYVSLFAHVPYAVVLVATINAVDRMAAGRIA